MNRVELISIWNPFQSHRIASLNFSKLSHDISLLYMHKYCVSACYPIRKWVQSFSSNRSRNSFHTAYTPLARTRVRPSRYFQSVRVYKRVETSRTHGWREEDNFYWKSAGIPASTIVTPPLTETGDGKFRKFRSSLSRKFRWKSRIRRGVELVASCRRMQKPFQAKSTARNLT